MGLIACSPSYDYYIDEDDNAHYPNEIDGSSDALRRNSEKIFKSKCINLINVGQDYAFYVSSNALFFSQSPRIISKNYVILDEMIDYFKQFRIVTVQVKAYQYPTYDKQRDTALALARAQQIVNYFSSQGVDIRIMVASQFTPLNSLSSLPAGDTIEISFRQTLK